MRATETLAADATQLLAAWGHARTQGLNNRAVAEKLGVSEAELVASGCGCLTTRLRADFSALLTRLPELGEIKCIVRNAWAVLERAGEVRGIETDAGGAQHVQADRFDAECQVALWRKGFALEEAAAHGTKLSLQFFNAEGVSAAKFFLRHDSSIPAFRSLVRERADSDQSTMETAVPSTPVSYMPLERLVAVRHDGLLRFLQAASRTQNPLHLLVRSGAAWVRTTKVVERVKRSDKGGWVNVLDDGLDLHLHEDKLRYIRLARDPDADSGWFHWFSDRRAVALSARVSRDWKELSQTAVAVND
jgi:putative heme degradation protein